jgi:hypothetical protein
MRYDSADEDPHSHYLRLSNHGFAADENGDISPGCVVFTIMGLCVSLMVALYLLGGW